MSDSELFGALRDAVRALAEREYPLEEIIAIVDIMFSVWCEEGELDG